MKLFIPLSALLLSMTMSSFAAEPSPAVKQAVLNAEEEWKTAVLKADRSALEKLGERIVRVLIAVGSQAQECFDFADHPKP